MTQPDPEAHYVGILEAVVAVLAVQQGINPTTMMGRVIEDITERTGMETSETELLIRSKWQGRDVSAGSLVARTFGQSNSDPMATLRGMRQFITGTEELEEAKQATPADRLQEWRARREKVARRAPEPRS